MEPTARNRFIGSKSYEEEDYDIFFGRSQEAKELIQLVNINSFTLFYGRSGLGKTSLLKAGVFPELYSKDYLPLYLRLNYTDERRDFIKQIEEVVTGRNSNVPIDPIYEIQQNEKEESLWEFLHQYPIKNSKTGHPVTPLIVFDQFEEIFTLGTKEKSGEFRDNVRLLIEFLSDLIENSPPDNLPEEKRMKLRFEYASVPIPVKILFSFKEEYLSNFYSLSSIIPSMAYSNLQYRLLPLNFEKGYSIIHEASQGLFEEDAIEETLRVITESSTIEEARGRDVDSFLLSVFCASRVDELKEGEKIRKKDIAKVDIQKLINSLYKNIVDELQLNKEEKSFIEDKLITAEGFRLPVYLNVVDAIPEVRKSKIEELERKNVLKRYFIDGNPCIEIIHDKYAAAVKSERDFRLNAELENLKIIQDKEKLEEEKKELEFEKAKKEKVISEREANLAREKLNLTRDKLKREKRIRRIAVVALFFFAAMTFFAINSFYRSQVNYKQAQINLGEAQKQKTKVDSINEVLTTQNTLLGNIQDTLQRRGIELQNTNDTLEIKNRIALAQQKEAEASATRERQQRDSIAMIVDSLRAERDRYQKLSKTFRATKDTLSGQRLVTSARNLKKSNPAIAYLLIKTLKESDPTNKAITLLYDSLANETGYFESRFLGNKKVVFAPDGRMVANDKSKPIAIFDMDGNRNSFFSESKNFGRALVSDDAKQVLDIEPSGIGLWVQKNGDFRLQETIPVKNLSYVSFLNDNQGFVTIEGAIIKIWNLDGVLSKSFKSPMDFTAIKSISKDSTYHLCIDWEKGITIINLASRRLTENNYLIGKYKLAFSIPEKMQFVVGDRNSITIRNFQGDKLAEIPILVPIPDNFTADSTIIAANGTNALLKFNVLQTRREVQKQSFFQLNKPKFENIPNSKDSIADYFLELSSGKAHPINKFLVTNKLAYNGSINSGFFSGNGKYFIGNFKDINFNSSTYIWKAEGWTWVLDGQIPVSEENLTGHRFLEKGNNRYVLTCVPQRLAGHENINTVLWIYGRARDLDQRGKLPKLSREELYAIAGIKMNIENQLKY